MHRASEPISAIAGALDKTQLELTNLEKSLLARFRWRIRAGATARFVTLLVEWPRLRTQVWVGR